MKLLVIDTSYNFKAIQEKSYTKLYIQEILMDFSKVWSIHPFGNIADISFEKSQFGKIKIHN